MRRPGGWADTYGMRLLVTGATGYIGGRLIPQLLGADRVPCPGSASGAAVPSVGRPGQVHRRRRHRSRRGGEAMDGAYYLMHSLTAGHGSRSGRWLQPSPAAPDAGVNADRLSRRMVPDVPPRKLSAHLRSRAEVGRILRAAACPPSSCVPGSSSAPAQPRSDVAISHRATAGDDHAAVGEDPYTAHRRARRPYYLVGAMSTTARPTAPSTSAADITTTPE